MNRRVLAPSDQPRPSQVVQADELWSDLLEMCPPSHREVLELKRQGLPLAEIASRTGLTRGKRTPSSVRPGETGCRAEPERRDRQGRLDGTKVMLACNVGIAG